MFVAFAFCWTYFFQAGLLEGMYERIVARTNIRLPYYRLLVSIVVVLFSWFLVLPSKLIIKFKKGLFACNYILPAIFLGAVTGFGRTAKVWILVCVFVALLLLVSKIVASVPKSDIPERGVSGAMLIMVLLFCMTALLGNTDENLHRRMLMDRYMKNGDYEKVLEIGRFEEESDEAIDLLRAKALIATDQIGDALFQYSISNPAALADSLDGCISLLLRGDVMALRDTIDLSAYSKLPRYYMEGLILAGDQRVQETFPEEYDQASDTYNQFLEAIETVKDEPKQYQANVTFFNYHESYYWFYYFKL